MCAEENELLSWWETWREKTGPHWSAPSWTDEDCIWPRDTWQLPVRQRRQNPAEPINAMATACESHSYTDVMPHASFTWEAVIHLLAHGGRVSMKQRVPKEVMGGYKGCVCVCVYSQTRKHFATVELCTWTHCLFCIARLSQMARVQTSRLCCWRLMENHHLCQATCQALPTALLSSSSSSSNRFTAILQGWA